MQSDPVAELSWVLGGFHSPPQWWSGGFSAISLEAGNCAYSGYTALVLMHYSGRTCPCPHAAPNGADSGDRAVHMQGKGTNAGYHLPSSTLPF